jgi:hypothetical protein
MQNFNFLKDIWKFFVVFGVLGLFGIYKLVEWVIWLVNHISINVH